MAADHVAYFEEVEARFEGALDFDLGLEEEFHVLDPESLELVPGFEALRDAAGERLRGRIAGELLRSEIEVSTPRTLHFGQAAKQMLHESLRALRARGPRGLRSRRHRHAPVLGLERPADRRHSPLPSGRRPAQVRRLAQQHVGGARTRRRAWLRPRRGGLRRAAHVPAAPPGAVGQLPLHRRRLDPAALGAHADLRAHVPALRHPGRVRHLGGALAVSTRSSSTRTASRSSRRSGGRCGRITASARSRCASATRRPRLGRASRSRR